MVSECYHGDIRSCGVVYQYEEITIELGNAYLAKWFDFMIVWIAESFLPLNVLFWWHFGDKYL